MIEQLTYHSVEELERLSLEELQALWELVPTDRQKAYRAAYDREVRNAGAIGSDQLEGRVAAELLNRYRESALVPVGSRWARTPQRVQEAAQENELPETDEGTTTASTGKPSPQLVAIFGVLIVILLGFMLFRVIGGGGGEIDPESTAEPSATPTLEVSPTPTPVALEAQDQVITGGDSERAVAYPVNLQVVTQDSSSPRVWVVQRRTVSAAEWNFDPNPDIASFVNGQITTRLRIYNGQSEAVTFTQDDIWLSLGYAADPPGPRNPAEGLLPFTLLPEQAVDLTLVWYRADEPYAALQVGSYRFAIQLERR